jgi:hypothetical protein
VICHSASASSVGVFDLHNMSQVSRELRSTSLMARQKKTPAKRGVIVGELGLPVRSSRGEQVASQRLGRSETGIREVTVADRNTGACHQQPIDSGHQTTE